MEGKVGSGALRERPEPAANQQEEGRTCIALRRRPSTGDGRATLSLTPDARERVAARLGLPTSPTSSSATRSAPDRSAGQVDRVDRSVELTILLRAIAPTVFCIP